MEVTQRARVCRATRRYVDMYTDTFAFIRGTAADSIPALCVGDFVSCTQSSDGSFLVIESHPRRNLLKRSSTFKSKILAANIDHLFILTAAGPICQPHTIDRVLIAAQKAGITVTLVWNKSDLGVEQERDFSLQRAYRDAGFEILSTSAVSSEGLDSLRAKLENTQYTHVVLTGVSGVGKSSIINELVSDASARTQSVSDKSGQGRQTTSEAFGYLYYGKRESPLMLCDLPGVQQFGLAHIEELDIRAGYPEFSQFASSCRFANCTHLEEPDCAVCAALESGRLAASRYNSYTQILKEFREYAA